MAQKNTVNVKEVNDLRNGNPSEETLREYFNRRERFFRAYKGKIPDFLEYSPIFICDRWRSDPN